MLLPAFTFFSNLWDLFDIIPRTALLFKLNNRSSPDGKRITILFFK